MGNENKTERKPNSSSFYDRLNLGGLDKIIPQWREYNEEGRCFYKYDVDSMVMIRKQFHRMMSKSKYRMNDIIAGIKQVGKAVNISFGNNPARWAN